MKYERKSCNYDLSIESYNIVGKASDELGIRKSYFLDVLIRKYGNLLIQKLENKFEEEEVEK